MLKAIISAIVYVFIAIFICPAAQAGTGSIYTLGDSLTDTNYYCNGWNTPLGTCSNYRNTAIRLGEVSAYSLNLSDSFSVGSTVSGTGTITVSTVNHPVYPGYSAGEYPNLLAQIDEFRLLGRSVSSNDLILLSYAGNDISYGNVGVALAETVAGNLSASVESLISLGGRNFVLLGGLPFDEITLGGQSLANSKGVSNADDKIYYTALNSMLPQYLAKYESEDVRVRVLDGSTLVSRVIHTPEMYGFLAGDCVDAYGGAGCLAQPLEVQNRYAFFGGHPSDSFSLVIANYITNLLNSAYQVPSQAELARDTAKSFSAYMSDRMAKRRSQNSSSRSSGKVELFMQGGYDEGRMQNRTGAYDADWGHSVEKAGAEYNLSESACIGAVAGIASPKSELGGSLGDVKLDSYQFGVYASLDMPDWFADFSVGGAVNNYKLSRPGVIDTLTAATSGGSFFSSAQYGLLFGTGRVKFGPIAGLGFNRATVRSYDENGDILLTQNVAGQKLDSLTGWAGVQLLAPPAAQNPRGISGRLGISAEHEFLPGSRNIITTGLDPASALSVITPVTCGITTYGKLTAGVGVPLTEAIGFDVMFDTTFARDSGNLRSVGVNLSYVFN